MFWSFKVTQHYIFNFCSHINVINQFVRSIHIIIITTLKLEWVFRSDTPFKYNELFAAYPIHWNFNYFITMNYVFIQLKFTCWIQHNYANSVNTSILWNNFIRAIVLLDIFNLNCPRGFQGQNFPLYFFVGEENAPTYVSEPTAI